MACPFCDDTGWKPIDDHGVRRVVRCECRHQQSVQRYLANANIPRRYQRCTLQNLRAYNDSLREAVARAQRFIDAFPGGTEQGLLFLGHAGVGKTHLAVATFRAVIEKGVPGIFWETSKLLAAIKNSYDPVARMSAATIVQPVMETPILVLDDLGAERPTDWVEETMNLIVSTRYNERRMTLMTSNYSDIPDIEDPNSLLSRIGFRMRSRLQEMCRTIEIDAADFRDEHRPENATDEELIALWRIKKRPKDLPTRSGHMAKAQMRDGKADLKWPGGRAGS